MIAATFKHTRAIILNYNILTSISINVYKNNKFYLYKD